MPLDYLSIDATKVTSLEPIRGMPLKTLHFGGTEISDVSPLAEIPTLEEIYLPKTARNVERLRSLNHLRYLSARSPAAQTAEEFWKEFDGQKAAGKK